MEEVLEICEAIKMEDRVAEVPKLRSEEIVWPIGHVFIHRLFGYAGVIRGWDETCEAGEQCECRFRSFLTVYGANRLLDGAQGSKLCLLTLYHEVVINRSTTS